jgi:hypothetical protein
VNCKQFFAGTENLIGFLTGFGFFAPARRGAPFLCGKKWGKEPPKEVSFGIL